MIQRVIAIPLTNTIGLDCAHRFVGKNLLLASGSVTGPSSESVTDTQARSTDISIHLSPARRGEPGSLGADSVAPTIHRNNNTSPTHITNRYKDPEVPDNLTQDLDNLTRRT